MSEMIIPSLAARKAARKKSQLAGGAELPSSLEPSSVTSVNAPENAPESLTTNTPQSMSAAQVTISVPVSESPVSTATNAQEQTTKVPPSVEAAPVQAMVSTDEAKRPEPSTISIQSIFPSPLEIEKVMEKSKTTPVTGSTINPAISKELLAKMARELGYELTQPKREFTKHTYSVTPHHKETMRQYVDVLGIAMQDAVCEAFDLFFAKHQAEFENVRKAKGK
jgi:hypothetical protein